MAGAASELGSYIKVLYPGAMPTYASVVAGEGGTYTIERWNVAVLGAKPTEAEVLARTAEYDAAIPAGLRAAAKAIVDALDKQGRLERAAAKVMIDEVNDLRAWITSFKAEVAASSSLADLKSRVAGLSAMPARTLTQAKTAIKNAVDGDA